MPIIRIIFSFCLLLWGSSILFAQNPSLQLMTALPSSLEETSGLEVNGPNSIWTHNDSGGEPKLYEIDSAGTIQRTLVIRNATNVDWEELAQDDQGRFYIGDFGNNNNSRTNLRIYRIPNPDSIVGDTATPEIIDFSYQDQAAFPPADSLKQFDMEAMVVMNDTIYLFSKNRTAPFDGICKVYSFPAVPGTHIAPTIGSFPLGAGTMEETWVTAADVSPDKEHIVVLSGRFFWIFSCFQGNDFLNGARRRLTHGQLSQKEAVCFRGDGNVYITDERFAGIFGGNLYRSNLNRWLVEPQASLGPDTVLAGGTILLDAGNMWSSYQWSTGSTNDTLRVDSTGEYWVVITAPNGCVDSDTIRVDVLVGMPEGHADQIRVHPNPSSGDFAIEYLGATSTPLKINLFTLQGHKIHSGRQGEWHLTGIPAGMYLLEIEFDTHREIIRLQIQH